MTSPEPTFEDNSFAAKASLHAVPNPAPTATERPKIEPVVTTPVQVRKPTVGDFFRGLLHRVIEEGKTTIKEQVLPNAKVMGLQAFNNLLAKTLKVDPAVTNGFVQAVASKPVTYGLGTPTPATNYQKITAKTTVPAPAPQPTANRYEFSRYVMGSRSEAQAVLEKMYMHLGQYGIVNVQDFFELIAVTPEWVDNGVGWTSLNGSTPAPHPHGGWFLKLPAPERLTGV